MRIYFHDNNNRYIGSREHDGEIPSNATTTSVAVQDGQEAFFVDGEWEVREVEIELIVNTEKSIEAQIEEMAEQLFLAQEALDFLIMGGV